MTITLARFTMGDVYVTGSLWVKGDTGLWHECKPSYDSVTGVVLWSVDPTGSSSYPEDAVDIGGRNLGRAFFQRSSDDGLIHQFIMYPANDSNDTGYVWQDYAQLSSTPVVRKTLASARVEDGLYLSDISGSQIHKMTVIGGLWSEETQGYTIPL